MQKVYLSYAVIDYPVTVIDYICVFNMCLVARNRLHVFCNRLPVRICSSLLFIPYLYLFLCVLICFCLWLSQKEGEIFAIVASDRGRNVLYQIGGVMSIMHDRGSNASVSAIYKTVCYNLILVKSKCRTVPGQAS